MLSSPVREAGLDSTGGQQVAFVLNTAQEEASNERRLDRDGQRDRRHQAAYGPRWKRAALCWCCTMILGHWTACLSMTPWRHDSMS